MNVSKEETKYSQTEQFANNYIGFFISKLEDCKQVEYGYNFREVKDEEGNTYYYSNNQDIYNYSNGIGAYINYVIIERKTGKMFTNIKSNQYQDVIDNMKNQEVYWNLVEGKIESNLNYINQYNLKYNYYEKYLYTEEYDIYSCYDEMKTTQATNFAFNRNIYNFLLQHKILPVYICAISIILLIMIVGYLLWSIGHSKEKEGISLNFIDKIPYEIISCGCLLLIIVFLSIYVNLTNSFYLFFLILTIMSYFICYVFCAILTVTTIKRIKSGTLWKSFLTYKIIRWCYVKIRKCINEFDKNTSSSKKIFRYYWGFVLISIILGTVFLNVFTLLVLIIFWCWVFYKLRKQGREQEEIKDALKEIYQGKTDIHLDDSELQGILKEMAIYINDIAGGFSNAIEQSLKSERLKTELITNVSHDIKTPLTSIINYVDLLKKENIEDEKVKEYVQILDNKSQRLKKLTEDLVEASKVSSGNVKLTIEEIDLKELLHQSIGEFKDRFETKNLKIELNIPYEAIKIKADNRYLYRVIENLFSNITKYALENSRVYIDVKKTRKDIEISIKNISKEKLNISSDELMQRFVRGDKSRYTDGSGLGLSIAKSLTELQGGNFDIVIDGDLFKVVINWKS